MSEGWALIYHGVDPDNRYRLGWALFDGDDPTRLVYRQAKPILEPELDWEKEGWVPNVVFSLSLIHIFVGPLAQGGLALANTLSSAFGAGVLLWILRKKLASTGSSSPVSLGGKAILDSLWRVLIASAIMGVVVWLTHGALEIYIPGSAVLMQLVCLAIAVIVGVICYVALVFILRVPEAGVVAVSYTHLILESMDWNALNALLYK